MALRVGAFVFYPNAVFFLLAGLFISTLLYRALRAEVVSTPVLVAAVIFTECGGVAGGWLYGLPARAVAESAAGLPPVSFDLRLGSFGGLWGMLAGAWLVGLLLKGGPVRFAAASVPALAAGVGVARIACLFQGCCQGVAIPAWGSFQPFKYWAAYDAASLIALAGLLQWLAPSLRPGHARIRLLGFLIGYGCVRFLLEFARDDASLAWGLTPGQYMAMIQTATGLLWLGWLGTSTGPLEFIRRPWQCCATLLR